MKIIKIGRNPGNDVIINDSKVSKTHCQIIKDDNGNVRIVDMNSTNGTYINGQRMKEKNLSQYDVVRIGDTTLPWQSYFSNPTVVNVGMGPTQIHQNSDAYVNIPHNSSVPTKPESITVWAVLCLVFCSLLFGIIGLIYGNKVDGLWSSGRYDEAIDSNKKAKTFCWIGLGIGVLRWALALVYI